MSTVRFAFIVALLTVPAWVGEAQEAIAVDQATIEQHVDHRVDPVYPPIAKAARIGGTVVLEVRVDPQGKVEATKVASGPPMLLQAAIDCVKQWTFHPFEKDGIAVAATGPLSIAFALTDYHPGSDDEQVADRYFPLFSQCNKAISARTDPKGAEDVCNQAAETAEKFAPEVRFIEKRSAFVYAATACANNRDLANALAWADKAVELVKLGHDDNSGSSAAYSVKGTIEGMAGDLASSDRDLSEAEDFGRKAVEWARQSQFEHGNYYERDLARNLQFHAKVLQALGLQDEAQKKLDEAKKYE